MAKTKIEWTQFSWNPVTGCTPCSLGCTHCYAKRMARRLAGRHGYPEAPHHFDVTLHPDRLDIPLRRKKPTIYFVCSMGDLFHEDVLEPFIFRVLKVTRDTPQHTYQILTKRPGRMAPVMCEYYAKLRAAYGSKAEEPQRNLWLGVSVENQATADERREYLERCPAAVKFVSYEPALGPVDWTGWEFVSQIISGGESGPGARPSHPDWHRGTRDFCQENGIAYFFKAWGAWMPYKNEEHKSTLSTWQGRTNWGSRIRFMHVSGSCDPSYKETVTMIRVGKKRAGHLLDGRAWRESP